MAYKQVSSSVNNIILGGDRFYERAGRGARKEGELDTLCLNLYFKGQAWSSVTNNWAEGAVFKRLYMTPLNRTVPTHLEGRNIIVCLLIIVSCLIFWLTFIFQGRISGFNDIEGPHKVIKAELCWTACVNPPAESGYGTGDNLPVPHWRWWAIPLCMTAGAFPDLQRKPYSRR